MKIHKYIVLVLFIATHHLVAQDFETVQQIELSSVPANSYLVNVSGKLSNGFSVKASANGPFFIRVNLQANEVPSPRKNSVCTETLLVPIDSESELRALTSNNKRTVYEYFDNLGRPSQTIHVQSSPTQKDVVSFNIYDESGRQPKEYLGYTIDNSSAGSFRDTPVSEQYSFYQSTLGIDVDSEPYKINIYDNTPSSEIKEVYGPGSDWHLNNKSIKTITQFNVASEVTLWKYNGVDQPIYSDTFSPNTLWVSQTTDEGSMIKRVYTDFDDHKIMERIGDGSIWNDTHYIYDNAGNLSYILPPEAVSRIATEYTSATSTNKQSFLDRWTFQYQYDTERRLIAKRTPGSVEGTGGWTYMVYDQWDRLVLVQDPVQRTRNEYSFTKYDRFNRVIMTGVYVTATTLSSLRSSINGSTIRFEEENSTGSVGYTLTSSKPSIAESDLLTINYYDSYSFLNNGGWDAEGNSYNYWNVTGYPQVAEKITTLKGQLSGSKVRVLGQTKWLNSVTYYDKKYRPIQIFKENNLGIIRSTSKFDFPGKVEKEQLYNSFSTLTTENSYSYSYDGQLLTLRQSINGNTPVLMVSNKYNELGQLIEKNVHSVDEGASFLQSVDYRYNIRNQKTSINNSTLTAEPGDKNPDLFGMELQYNPSSVISINNSTFTTRKFYNGNISAIKWKTDVKQGTPVEQIYGYDYDESNRLKQAYYASNLSGVWNGNGGMFDEQVKNYDKNGNIKGILRYGKVQENKTIIDNLTLGYSLSGYTGNRLITVDDASNNAIGFKPASTNITEEYQYDYNGNLKFDFNKGISNVEYNYLNLPTLVEFTRSNGSIDRIEYTYDAWGNKIKKVIKVNGSVVWTTDYAGNAQYDNGKLSFFSTPEGRAKFNSGDFSYEYFLTDHQGNIRVGYGPLKETASYNATMETPAGSNLASDEEATFRNISTTRSNPDPVFNYTASSEKVQVPNRSARCNGFINSAIGPAKELRVLSGDGVYMEVFAKYWNAPSNSSTIITNLVSVVGSSFTTPSPTDAVTFSQQLSTNLPPASTAISVVANIPKAYLMWLFFDDNYIFQRSGAQAIGTNAYRAFEKLSRSFTADKNGHLYIYVANEGNESAGIDVYFDELYIVHQKTTSGLQVTQASDYYPFGLSFNQYNSDRINQTSSGNYAIDIRNRNLYQGQDLQKDLDLNLYQFEARMLDPAIGRFAAVDPLSEKFFGQTPYNSLLNSPVNLIDPDGRQPGYPYNNPDPFRSVRNYQNQQTTLYYQRQAGIGIVGSYVENQMAAAQRAEISRLGGNGGDGRDRYSAYDHMKTFAKVADFMPMVGPLTRMYGGLLRGDMSEVAWGGGLAMLEVASGPILDGVANSRIGASVLSKVEQLVTGKTIALGLDVDLALHRGTGAITYKNAGWQQAGLTDVDWGRAVFDEFYFKESFGQAAKNADAIVFNVSSFNPFYANPQLTNYEFNQIINNATLFQKTTFVSNGSTVFWNGSGFH